MSAGKLPRTFLDSNILVYADDESEPVKKRIAIEIVKNHMRQRNAVVSLQVLQEYFVTVTRKLHLEVETARAQVEFFSGFSVAAPSVRDILGAIDLHRFHGFSYWDALILRMAKQSGCRILLSEDLQHGRVVDGVEIVNPFL
jgi:predicted nucleic acid-binding protein